MKVIFEDHDQEFNLDTLKKLIEVCKSKQSDDFDERAWDIHLEIEDCYNRFVLAMSCNDERAADPIFGQVGTIEMDHVFWTLLDPNNIEVLEESFEPMLTEMIKHYE